MSDRATDVVVVGSGAAGLTAAATAADAGLAVELIEKAPLLGGTTAVSGGGIWAPDNPHMAALGAPDSRADALCYARSTTAGREPDPALVERYLDAVLEAIAFLEQRGLLSLFVARRFSDYYADRPGGRRVGRTLDNEPFAARDALGEWDERIRRGPHYPRLTLDELSGGDDPDADRGGGAGAGPIAPELLARGAQRERDGIRTRGEALVARLLRGVLDRGVRVSTSTPVTALVCDGDGAVTGVRVQGPDGPAAVQARRGVVLACGGFEWNPELVRAYLGVTELRPASPPHNVGDGIVMALEAGALVANMTEAWWFPVTSTGTLRFEGAPLHTVGTPRAEAGCITVNRHGRRFANEGACYMDLGRARRAYDVTAGEFPNDRAWSIFDQHVRERIELADCVPGEPTPAWVRQAATLSELAEAIGVDADGLCAEVERFNGFARAGHDPDHGRGTLWFEGMTSGGPRPERALAPISQPPFYAMELHHGVLGTCGGPRIDGDGRVRAARGGMVPGLYAAGNTAASVFGPGYPAGGATLGPAIAFAYRAGRHLAVTER